MIGTFVHPIEYRYKYPEMYAVFSEEAKLESWLDVEVALAPFQGL
jgi:adenylosuccinate lyase